MSRFERLIVGIFTAFSIAISVAGLLAVGFFIVVAIAMSQYGSSK